MKHVVLIEISVRADQDHRDVSDFIDGILEQIIERRVGRIVAFHDRSGERPKSRLTSETEGSPDMGQYNQVP